MSVRIIVGSTSDITREQAEKLKIDIMPLKTIFGEEEFLDGVNLSHREFYEKLIESDMHPTTSQIPPYEYEEMFGKVKEAGDTAVCITISAKLSGCYQSANVALEGYEDIIHLVDSETVAIGEWLLIEHAVKLRDAGLTAGEIAEALELEKKKIRVIALLDTLEYLKKGGRISVTAAMAGGLLSIKPVITVEDGLLVTIGKARGSKNGQNLLREYTKKMHIDYSRPGVLAYTGLSDMLLKKYVEDSKEIYEPFGYELPVHILGSAIGTHAGPGAIAVAFFSE